MTTIICSPIQRTYVNAGQHCEQMLAYTLTGEIRKANKEPFDKASDIPELNLSVKSSHATLVSPSVLISDTYSTQIDEFFDRTASTQFAYVSKEHIAYIMNKSEFRKFVYAFSYWDREATSHGHENKVRLRSESKKMIHWLNDMVNG